MPQGDGTGPAGQGPMTGRGMGFCTGFNVPGFMNPGFGRGFGRGRGRGFRFSQPVQFQPQVITQEQEKQMLQEELKALEQETKEIQQRLKEMKG